MIMIECVWERQREREWGKKPQHTCKYWLCFCSNAMMISDFRSKWIDCIELMRWLSANIDWYSPISVDFNIWPYAFGIQNLIRSNIFLSFFFFPHIIIIWVLGALAYPCNKQNQWRRFECQTKHLTLIAWNNFFLENCVIMNLLKRFKTCVFVCSGQPRPPSIETKSNDSEQWKGGRDWEKKRLSAILWLSKLNHCNNDQIIFC